MYFRLLSILLLAYCLPVSAQEQFALSGYVRDADTGETLVGATVTVADDPSLGASTNAYGFYSLRLPEGRYKLQYAYLGYDAARKAVQLDSAVRLNVELRESGIELKEVVVKARPDDTNVKSTEMGTVGLKWKR